MSDIWSIQMLYLAHGPKDTNPALAHSNFITDHPVQQELWVQVAEVLCTIGKSFKD